MRSCDLYGGAGRMLQFHESVSFILEFVHLALMGQQAVVLKILFKIKSNKVDYLPTRQQTKDIFEMSDII